MMQLQRVLKLAGFCAMMAALLPAPSFAQNKEESEVERQARLARRGAGVRAGVWQAEVQSTADGATRGPHFEGYFQRGLDKHLAMENSAGVWWVTTTASQSIPLGGSEEVETRSYVVPLLTSLKFYPITEVTDRVEPYLLAGIGFALGLEDQADNAIGGGGTSMVTGFGARAGVGVETHLNSSFGLAAGAKYQWIRFGEELGSTDTFRGFGAELGITYRFQF